MEIDAVLNERGSRYGDYAGHAAITQAIKYAMHGTPNWARLNASQAETLDMVAHKIGRILNGDPDYLDSWVDIVGYTQLVVKQLERIVNTNAVERGLGGIVVDCRPSTNVNGLPSAEGPRK